MERIKNKIEVEIEAYLTTCQKFPCQMPALIFLHHRHPKEQHHLPNQNIFQFSKNNTLRAGYLHKIAKTWRLQNL